MGLNDRCEFAFLDADCGVMMPSAPSTSPYSACCCGAGGKPSRVRECVYHLPYTAIGGVASAVEREGGMANGQVTTNERAPWGLGRVGVGGSAAASKDSKFQTF